MSQTITMCLDCEKECEVVEQEFVETYESNSGFDRCLDERFFIAECSDCCDAEFKEVEVEDNDNVSCESLIDRSIGVFLSFSVLFLAAQIVRAAFK